MPPHLHPRSAMTMSLFTTTLAVSFLVVGVPHLLPCPVRPQTLAEGSMEGVPDQAKRRRKRRPMEDSEKNKETSSFKDVALEDERRQRECPVPKPQGLIGQLMGFERKEQQLEMPIKIAQSQSRTEVASGED